jgi:hypothetical protein
MRGLRVRFWERQPTPEQARSAVAGRIRESEDEKETFRVEAHPSELINPC